MFVQQKFEFFPTLYSCTYR